MTNTGFVVGLASEARILTRALESHDPGAARRVAVAAADERRAGELARQLLAEGAEALVSFGMAGGLDPALRPGDLVLPEAVRLPDGSLIATAPAWRARWMTLARELGLRCAGGGLTGSPQPVLGIVEKRRLRERAGAAAVDMESHAVAAVAARAAVPFIAVRAIADPAGRALPQAVVGSIGPDGRPRIGRLAGRLCLRPWEVSRLLRVSRDAAAALRSLGRLAGALGPAVLDAGGRS